jgi:hypothetical protein
VIRAVRRTWGKIPQYFRVVFDSGRGRPGEIRVVTRSIMAR